MEPVHKAEDFARVELGRDCCSKKKTASGEPVDFLCIRNATTSLYLRGPVAQARRTSGLAETGGVAGGTLAPVDAADPASNDGVAS